MTRNYSDIESLPRDPITNYYFNKYENLSDKADTLSTEARRLLGTFAKEYSNYLAQMEQLRNFQETYCPEHIDMSSFTHLLELETYKTIHDEYNTGLGSWKNEFATLFAAMVNLSKEIPNLEGTIYYDPLREALFQSILFTDSLTKDFSYNSGSQEHLYETRVKLAGLADTMKKAAEFARAPDDLTKNHALFTASATMVNSIKPHDAFTSKRQTDCAMVVGFLFMLAVVAALCVVAPTTTLSYVVGVLGGGLMAGMIALVAYDSVNAQDQHYNEQMALASKISRPLQSVTKNPNPWGFYQPRGRIVLSEQKQEATERSALVASI